MSKQTAVELLKRDLDSEIKSGTKMVVNWDMYIEVEKQQHAKTWDTALNKYEVRAGNYMRAYEDFDDYFAETYVNNHIVDTNEMVDKEIFEQAIKSMEEMYGSGCDSEIDAYFRGAKWMQKQFKENQQ